jgi:hypothetical protein
MEPEGLFTVFKSARHLSLRQIDPVSAGFLLSQTVFLKRHNLQT